MHQCEPGNIGKSIEAKKYELLVIKGTVVFVVIASSSKGQRRRGEEEERRERNWMVENSAEVIYI